MYFYMCMSVCVGHVPVSSEVPVLSPRLQSPGVQPTATQAGVRRDTGSYHDQGKCRWTWPIRKYM